MTLELFCLKFFKNLKDELITELPKWICQQCKQSLNNAFEFKTLCEKGDKDLRELVRGSKITEEDIKKIPIKSEPFDEEYEVEKVQVDVDVTEYCSDDNDDAGYMNDVHEDSEKEEEEPEESQSSEDEKLSNIKARIKSNNKLKCLKCDKMFRVKGSLTRHNRIFHENGKDKVTKINKRAKRVEKIYDCKHCEMKFNRRLRYYQHMKIHGYKCDTCDTVFDRQSRLNQHLAVEHKAAINCNQCDKTFKYKASLDRHVRCVHNKEVNCFCEVCNKGCFDLSVLKLHKLSHIPEKTHQCDICQKMFKRASLVTAHKITHLSQEERDKLANAKSYLCPHCGKILHTLAGRNSHLLIHLNDPKFECKLCHKKFLTSFRLVIHERTHSGERPFSCKLCHQTFKQQSHLATHKISHTGGKIFTCKVCGVSMKYKDNLLHHMKNVHWGVRNFSCDQCDDKFYTSNLLKQHKARNHSI